MMSINSNKLVTAEEMKVLDNNTIENMGVPSMVLMERAALACAEELLEEQLVSDLKQSTTTNHSFDTKKVLCICGAGNNGGDGFAIARLLHFKEIDAEVLFIGDRERCSAETAQQYKICENYGISIYDNDLDVIINGGYTTVVDAIFGIGLQRIVEGKFAQAINDINTLKAQNKSKILAVDIPSGIATDSGKVMGVAVKADKTVTFAYNKIGLTIGDGPTYAGDIKVKDIGIYTPK